MSFHLAAMAAAEAVVIVVEEPVKMQAQAFSRGGQIILSDLSSLLGNIFLCPKSENYRQEIER